MQSFCGPQTRGGKEYKTPGVTMAYTIIDGSRQEYKHSRLELEIDAEKNTSLIWRAYSLHPGKRQGMRPVLEATAHIKITCADLIRSSERQPFFTIDCDEIQCGSSTVSGTIGLVLEDRAVLRL